MIKLTTSYFVFFQSSFSVSKETDCKFVNKLIVDEFIYSWTTLIPRSKANEENLLLRYC